MEERSQTTKSSEDGFLENPILHTFQYTKIARNISTKQLFGKKTFRKLDHNFYLLMVPNGGRRLSSQDLNRDLTI